MRADIRRFELHRRSDGLVYLFYRDGQDQGRPVYRREDRPDLQIRWDDRWGWIAKAQAERFIAGRPWEILPQDQVDRAPPQGLWVSQRGETSHAYDLIHL